MCELFEYPEFFVNCLNSQTARRSNQSILKEVSPEYSLEGLMLKLIIWPPNVKSRLIGKDPNVGKG